MNTEGEKVLCPFTIASMYCVRFDEDTVSYRHRQRIIPVSRFCLGENSPVVAILRLGKIPFGSLRLHRSALHQILSGKSIVIARAFAYNHVGAMIVIDVYSLLGLRSGIIPGFVLYNQLRTVIQ